MRAAICGSAEPSRTFHGPLTPAPLRVDNVMTTYAPTS